MKSTLREVEVKVKVNDFTKITKELRKLGCKLSELINQEDRIYLPLGTNLTQITTETNILRLRQQNGKNILTLKRNSVNALAKLEKETYIEDLIQMEEIIKYLGFYQVTSVKKVRTKCKLNDMEICLDNVEGLGKYIEVEKITAKNPISVQKELLKFLASIGVNISDRVLYGYDILIYLKTNPEHEKNFK